MRSPTEFKKRLHMGTDMIWKSKVGDVLISEMHPSHLVAAIRYVENKARYAIQQILFVSGVIHVDLVSLIPSETKLRELISPQYTLLVQELELRAHRASGCDDHKCPVKGCVNSKV